MSLLLSQGPRKRLVVLGLDGLPLELARGLGSSLPNLSRLVQGATTVKAELPELSPVNWTAFFTGQGPEKHGVFGFSHLDPQTYSLRITNATDIACPTIFDKLGEQGLVSRFVNLPNTYPMHPFRGMGISGFVSLDPAQSVYPPFLSSKLRSADYKLEADTSRGRADLDYLMSELRHTLRSRLDGLEMLWPDLGWDLFVHVFTETDRLFHFFLDAVVNQESPHHFTCMRFLVDWDNALGVFLKKYDLLPDPKRLLVMADHGFTLLRTEVCLNTWLQKEGFLSFTFPPKDEWDMSPLSDETTAFALDPGRIYIHTRKRFARGPVPEQDVPRLTTDIVNRLKQLTFNGNPIMKTVHIGRELYPGAPMGHVPDIVCQGHPGFDLKAKSDRNDIFGLHGRTGTHTVDGAFFKDTAGSRPKRMRDIGQIILHHFDIKE